MAKARFVTLIAVCLMSVSGCSSSVEPYREVQVCFGDKGNLLRMLDAIQKIAKDSNLTVVDHSKETGDQLKSIGAQDKLKYDVSGSINVGMFKDDNVKVMISNLGLPSYQVLVSFFGSKGEVADQGLSERVVNELSKFSRVQNVPAGHGALPMASCSS